MGSVWLAKHEVLDAEVAVKLMSPALADTPTARARFERVPVELFEAGLRVAVSVDLGSWDVEEDVKRNTLAAAGE